MDSQLRKSLTSTGKARILVAEDNREMLHLLSIALLTVGYDVIQCENGMQVLERLGPGNCLLRDIDLIITDIRMPGVTGLEVLEGLQDVGDRPPMIMLTAFGDEDTHNKAKALGAAEVIDKPFEIDHLLARVREVLAASGWDASRAGSGSIAGVRESPGLLE